jgi:hypothetical protein
MGSNKEETFAKPIYSAIEPEAREMGRGGEEEMLHLALCNTTF